jgi:hypothetical protein
MVLFLVLAGIFYWRLKILQQPFSINNTTNNNSFEIQSTEPNAYNLNTFPIQAGGELGNIYRLDCSFDEIILYQNYQRSPMLPGNWRCLAAMACSYLNSNQQLEQIYLPLRVYNTSTQQVLLVGSSIQQENEEEVIRLAEMTSTAWYEKMIEHYLVSKPEPGKKIKIVANFPSEEFQNNQTKGLAFETLKEANPPYTKSDLENFYQSGDSQYLPEINGKHYFWPVIGYSF